MLNINFMEKVNSYVNEMHGNPSVEKTGCGSIQVNIIGKNSENIEFEFYENGTVDTMVMDKDTNILYEIKNLPAIACDFNAVIDNYV